jgi:hypothetical protein
MMRIKAVAHDYITLEISDTLARRDYEFVLPELQRLMTAKGGRLNVMLQLDDFKGWDPRALELASSFGVKESHEAGRVAVVGERGDEQAAKRIAAPLFSGDVRFFQKARAAWAKQWLQSGINP